MDRHETAIPFDAVTGPAFVRGWEALAGFVPDVLVVGAGPVGLVVAAGLAARNRRVLVVEAGPRTAPGRPAGAEVVEFVDPARHSALDLALGCGFGGTSRLWGGRCLPFDPIDLEPRDYLGLAGWPIRESEISPFYEEAARVLGCSPATFSVAGARTPNEVDAAAMGLRLDQLERWCDDPFTPRHLERLSLPGKISVLCGATVTGLVFERGMGVVAGVWVAHEGRLDSISAPFVVIACGGLETTRLLLNIQERHPELFGGPGGPLGRHYMGHVSGSIAKLRFVRPERAILFAYRTDRGSAWRRRLTLDAATQRAERLPNVAFYPANPRIGDASHGSGVLSALYLLLSAPVIGPWLVSEAIRQMQLEHASDSWAHAGNILKDIPGTVRYLTDVLCQKLIKGRHKPNIFLLSRDGNYPLHYHAEHRPAACSRVSLNNRRDRFGLRGLCVDFRFTDEDAEGVVRAHRVLDERAQRSGIGALSYHHEGRDRSAAVLSQARDGFHQMGLTRMAESSRDGVVNSDCRVFGFDNLFLAGTSVLATSGQANPTFFAAGLGARLAAHLDGAMNGHAA